MSAVVNGCFNNKDSHSVGFVVRWLEEHCHRLIFPVHRYDSPIAFLRMISTAVREYSKLLRQCRLRIRFNFVQRAGALWWKSSFTRVDHHRWSCEPFGGNRRVVVWVVSGCSGARCVCAAGTACTCWRRGTATWRRTWSRAGWARGWSWPRPCWSAARGRRPARSCPCRAPGCWPAPRRRSTAAPRSRRTSPQVRHCTSRVDSIVWCFQIISKGPYLLHSLVSNGLYWITGGFIVNESRYTKNNYI